MKIWVKEFFVLFVIAGDKGLMQSLVMDAKVTHEFGDKKKENGHHHISKDKDDDR